jgi:hypothetical protein
MINNSKKNPIRLCCPQNSVGLSDPPGSGVNKTGSSVSVEPDGKKGWEIVKTDFVIRWKIYEPCRVYSS